MCINHCCYCPPFSICLCLFSICLWRCSCWLSMCSCWLTNFTICCSCWLTNFPICCRNCCNWNCSWSHVGRYCCSTPLETAILFSSWPSLVGFWFSDGPVSPVEKISRNDWNLKCKAFLDQSNACHATSWLRMTFVVRGCKYPVTLSTSYIKVCCLLDSSMCSLYCWSRADIPDGDDDLNNRLIPSPMVIRNLL